MIKFLKKHKSGICSLLVALLIFVLMVLIIYFSNEDKKKLFYSNDIDIQENDILYESAINPINSQVPFTLTTYELSQADSKAIMQKYGFNQWNYYENVTLVRRTLSYQQLKSFMFSQQNESNYIIDFNNLSLAFNMAYENYIEIQDYDEKFGFIYINADRVYTYQDLINYTGTYPFIYNIVNHESSIDLTYQLYLPVNEWDYLTIFYISNMIDEQEGNEYLINMSNYMFIDSTLSNSFYQTQINDLNNELSSVRNEYNNLNSEYNNLNSEYQLLDNQYYSLLDQYNLISQNNYTFSELFWSISAVPFGVLTSTFNVEVLGVNLAGVITGLITSLILLWLIKRLFK